MAINTSSALPPWRLSMAVSGSGGLSGALIGNAITVSGSGDVHYDVQLGTALVLGGPNPGVGEYYQRASAGVAPQIRPPRTPRFSNFTEKS